jgi:Carboxypeptidase regulatory-like domain
VRLLRFFWSVLLGLLVPLAALAQAPPVRLTIELLPIGSSQALEGTLVLRPVGGKPESALRMAVHGPAPVAVEITPGAPWELLAEISGLWAPRRVLPAGTPGMEMLHRLPLWPVAKASGTVKVEKGESRPRDLKLEIRAAGNRTTLRDVPASQVSCPVADNASWSCELPAAALDVVLSAEGFIPHYLWGVPFKAGEELPFGKVELKRGASVVGWVTVEEGSLAPDCRVRLSPLVAPGGLRDPAIEKIKRLTLEAAVNERGFFQIAGVPSGSYLLEAEQPGFANARMSPLEIWAKSEISLQQPLVLRRPLNIELQIVPSVDWIGKAWKVRVARGSDFSAGFDPAPVYEGPADEQGRMTLRGQAPGRFWILVSDSANNLLYNDFDVPIQEAGDARRIIEIGAVSVRGRVLFGKEPIAATLWFGGRSGAVRVEMESDEEGSFEGMLPRDGAWRVYVRSADDEVEASTKVSIEANEKGRASVTVSLPDTHLFGRVVDEQSKPVAGASVEVETGQDGLQVWTDAQGKFQVRGLPPGLLTAAAELDRPSGSASSEPAQVLVAEGQPTGPVELRLRRSKPFVGQVVSSRGPVPGASVEIFPRRPAGFFGSSSRTGLDGSFSAQIPEPTETVVAVVSAPGHALKAFEVEATGAPVTLSVPSVGGGLEVTVPDIAETMKAGDLLLVFQDGRSVPFATLRQWALGHGVSFYTPGPPGQLHYPNLAPGEYRVCIIPNTAVPDWEVSSWIDRAGRCASGRLESSETLRLELPAAQKRASASE